MKSKHIGIWIIHIKLKCFRWEEILQMGQEREKNNTDNRADFLREENKIN